ncbi:MAG: ABC transporter permease [Zavarzinia sp.]|nr:ABC transporter permease [Zavarzinia sp.]
MTRILGIFSSIAATRAVLAGVWALRLSILAFTIVPMVVIVWLSFSADTFTRIPPDSYSLHWYAQALSDGRLIDGFLLSIQIAVMSALIALGTGTLAAYGLWRYRLVGSRLIATLVSLPVVIPTVVTGLAFLGLFSRLGMYDAFLNIVLGHVVIALPFAFRSVVVAFARYNARLDEAAASLGANGWRVFINVTLPQVRPGIFAGGLFAFVVSFDDFNIAAFLVDAETVTLPVSMYQYLLWLMDPTLTAVSAMVTLLTVIGAVIIHRWIGLGRLLGVDI